MTRSVRPRERTLHVEREANMHNQISKVLELKGRDIQTVSPETTVLIAVQQMNRHKIGALLVTDRGRPIGIFTERDVLVRVVAAGLDPRITPVNEVMTRSPVIVRSEASVAEAMVVITERRCRHLPVIDDDGLCGLISIGDLTSWMVRDQQRTIEDLHDYMARA
jgi:CBS domain-containing protein